MIDLKNVTEALSSVVEARQSVQAQLGGLKQRKQELLNLPLPKDDFIQMVLDEQGLRENQLSERLFKKYKSRIHSPMSPLKIRGIQDSPLTWPVGTNDIPNDTWHTLFTKEINAAITKAITEWDYPTELGPTRAERKKELAKLEEEITALKTWLDQAAKLSPQ